ncbi:MAG: Mur ligase family protein, partial [Myxococcota bacterium]
GKTTTKELLRVMWQTYGPTHATRGNYNNHIGVPLTLANAPAEVDTLVVEMGANQPGDIGQLIRLAPGGVRIVTSIGHAHIAGFGGLEGVRRTKREIFNGSTEHTLAIVPATERDHLLDRSFPGRVVTFGPRDGPDADVTFSLATPETPGEGVRVVVHLPGTAWSITSPLHGAHNASNLAAACATQSFTDGVHADGELVTAALGHLDLPDGRWRVVEVGQAIVVDDAYNANPSSVMASLDGFDQWQKATAHPGKRVVVLGEMLELGERAKYWHEEISRCMSRLRDLDVFIAVGPFATAMVEAARDELGPTGVEVQVHGVDTPAGAADVIVGLGPCVVFLKGSRGAKLERIIDAVQDGLDETSRAQD